MTMIIRTSTELGLLVRDHRTRRELTQAELAERIGASRKWVIDLEAGKRTAELSLVLRALNVLRIELHAIEPSERDATMSSVSSIIDTSQAKHRQGDA